MELEVEIRYDGLNDLGRVVESRGESLGHNPALYYELTAVCRKQTSVVP